MKSPFDLDTRTWNRDAVIRDYRVTVRSRHASVIARGEVHAGRAKFGIFGDGKEAAQMAMAYAFRHGDFRSGYYRDQTFMFALGLLTPQQFFAQLYAHPDPEAEPSSGGRQMTSHFATRLVDEAGRALNHVDRYNSSADLSPTGSQMPRLVGLAYASKLYRENPVLAGRMPRFSNNGNEIAFGTIGNASCAEGLFWESVNAVGVLQVPMLLSIWDDGFGISVPNAFQMTKGDISRILQGFQHRHGGRPGLDIQVVRGWNYPELLETYIETAIHVRADHTPAIIHVTELTQPLGHSTSGNHERYKSAERLEWEKEHDCLIQLGKWILDHGLADAATLDAIDREEKEHVLQARESAWRAFREPIEAERAQVVAMMAALESEEGGRDVADARKRLESRPDPLRRDLMAAATEALLAMRGAESAAGLRRWKHDRDRENTRRYGAHLYSESEASALQVPTVPPRYGDDAPVMKGFEILNLCLDRAFERMPELVAIGEDVGLLGGVNQGWAHMQEKYGASRVTDTGIREATIVGQAIGMALRGLRPIAEIQYLDYVLYALQIIADDLATLRWRTAGGQKAPVLVHTRGHRLEGVWHSGSPMSGIMNLVRGVYVCVPRNSVEASGLYNTMLRSDDSALIIEALNAYRLKEKVPENIDEFTIPLGVPAVLREGGDVTIVTYGPCCGIALAAAEVLAAVGISVEVLDVRTLVPFDVEGKIGQSLEKTNRVLFLDEDVPGGATAAMMQDVLERQGGYDWLDSPPRTLSARAHRPAYGSDGDYFSKPNREDVVHTVYGMMRESDPGRFARLS